MADIEDPIRYDQKVSITTTDKGTITMRVVDRINVDDVFLHLVNREFWKLTTGEDTGVDTPKLFKQFLLKEQFTTGQS